MAISVPETFKIRELQTDMLEQKKVYALLLHDKETADTERNLLREEVYTLYRNRGPLSQSSCFPALPSCSPPLLPILRTEKSDCSIAENTFGITSLLGNLRQAYGTCKIREEGNKLVSHLRNRATERKRAFMIAEKEKNYALIELETAEILMKGRETKFKKEMKDLSQEVFSISFIFAPRSLPRFTIVACCLILF